MAARLGSLLCKLIHSRNQNVPAISTWSGNSTHRITSQSLDLSANKICPSLTSFNLYIQLLLQIILSFEQPWFLKWQWVSDVLSVVVKMAFFSHMDSLSTMVTAMISPSLVSEVHFFQKVKHLLSFPFFLVAVVSVCLCGFALHYVPECPQACFSSVLSARPCCSNLSAQCWEPHCSLSVAGGWEWRDVIWLGFCPPVMCRALSEKCFKAQLFLSFKFRIANDWEFVRATISKLLWHKNVSPCHLHAPVGHSVTSQVR